MVASFINSGVLNQELFFQSGRELLFVWVRLETCIDEFRAAMKDPDYYKNLETVATAYATYLKKKNPEAYQGFVDRVRG